MGAWLGWLLGAFGVKGLGVQLLAVIGVYLDLIGAALIAAVLFGAAALTLRLVERFRARRPTNGDDAELRPGWTTPSGGASSSSSPDNASGTAPAAKLLRRVTNQSEHEYRARLVVTTQTAHPFRPVNTDEIRSVLRSAFDAGHAPKSVYEHARKAVLALGWPEPPLWESVDPCPGTGH